MARKVKWLIGVIVAVMALWSVLWYGASVAAGKVLDRVERRSVEMGRDVRCENRTVSGFPFHIEVSCGQAGLDAQEQGIAADVDAVRSVALLYNPGLVITEADGPLTIKLSPAAGLTGELTGRWKTARSSVSAGLSGLKRASFVAEDVILSTTARTGLAGLEQVSLKDAQLHLRPNPEVPADFDVALTVSDMLTTRFGGELPTMDLRLLATAGNVGEALGFDPEMLIAPGLTMAVHSTLNQHVSAVLDFLPMRRARSRFPRMDWFPARSGWRFPVWRNSLTWWRQWHRNIAMMQNRLLLRSKAFPPTPRMAKW